MSSMDTSSRGVSRVRVPGSAATVQAGGLPGKPEDLLARVTEGGQGGLSDKAGELSGGPNQLLLAPSCPCAEGRPWIHPVHGVQSRHPHCFPSSFSPPRRRQRTCELEVRPLGADPGSPQPSTLSTLKFVLFPDEQIRSVFRKPPELLARVLAGTGQRADVPSLDKFRFCGGPRRLPPRI